MQAQVSKPARTLDRSAYFVDQQHSAYTSAEHGVWRTVLSRNAALIAQYGARMHPAYIVGARALALPTHIPGIEELNERLAPTGWKTVCVDGYIPTSAYVGLMSENIFPVSRMVRREEHIDFAPAPDFVHDVLGHLPMLFSPEYREFIRRLAAVMAKAVPNALDDEFYDAVLTLSAVKSSSASSPRKVADAEARMRQVIVQISENASELTHLRRMYVWSTEFGLMGNRESFSIHGAALLSSPSEFRSVCDGSPQILPFSLDVIHHENAFSDVLSQYFVARDFAQLADVLSSYERRMLQAEVAPRTSEARELLTISEEPRRNHA